MLTANQIRRWRCETWDDFVGESIRPQIDGYRLAAMQGELAGPDLLIGPYGGAKTSLGKKLLLTATCDAISPTTGEPCGACASCVNAGPQFNGPLSPGVTPHWEIDAPRVGARKKWRELIEEWTSSEHGAVFIDELHGIDDPRVFQLLHKFVEGHQGMVVLAITDEGLASLTPDLYERCARVVLQHPSAQEMIGLFEVKLDEWEVRAAPELLRLTVEQSERSFRKCLQVFASAARQSDRTLTRPLIETLLGPCSP